MPVDEHDQPQAAMTSQPQLTCCLAPQVQHSIPKPETMDMLVCLATKTSPGPKCRRNNHWFKTAVIILVKKFSTWYCGKIIQPCMAFSGAISPGALKILLNGSLSDRRTHCTRLAATVQYEVCYSLAGFKETLVLAKNSTFAFYIFLLKSKHCNYSYTSPQLLAKLSPCFLSTSTQAQLQLSSCGVLTEPFCLPLWFYILQARYIFVAVNKICRHVYRRWITNRLWPFLF